MLEARLMTHAQINEAYGVRVKELITEAGGYTHLAIMLNISAQNTFAWEKRERISKAGAKLVGNHPTLNKKFSAYYLRPDLALDEPTIDEIESQISGD